MQRRIGLYWILATLRVALTFVSQTGYIHPDEFFQSIEVISGMLLFCYATIILTFSFTSNTFLIYTSIFFLQETTSISMSTSHGNSMPLFPYVPRSFLKLSLVCLMPFLRDCLHIPFTSSEYRWRTHISLCSFLGFSCVRSPSCRITFCTKSVICTARITKSGLSRMLVPTLCSRTQPVHYPTLLNWYWLPRCCTTFLGAWRFRRRYVQHFELYKN